MYTCGSVAFWGRYKRHGWTLATTQGKIEVTERPVYSPAERFENARFALYKHHPHCAEEICKQRFPSTLRREIGTTITRHFVFLFQKTRAEKSHDYRDVIVFEKTPFYKCFPSTRNRKAGVFKFLWFEELIEKLRFRDGLMWTVGLTVEIKLRFKFLQCTVFLLNFVSCYIPM